MLDWQTVNGKLRQLSFPRATQIYLLGSETIGEKGNLPPCRLRWLKETPNKANGQCYTLAGPLLRFLSLLHCLRKCHRSSKGHVVLQLRPSRKYSSEEGLFWKIRKHTSERQGFPSRFP